MLLSARAPAALRNGGQYFHASSSSRAVVRRVGRCAALPKRRRQPPRRRQQQQRSEEPAEPVPLSDEALIRQLNSPHPWMPEADADFGLDDVAAHVASKDQPQVVDFGSSSSRSQGRRRSGAPADASTAAAGEPRELSQLDPTAAGPLPVWIDSLRQEGFDLMSRNGQLFMQRGTISQQQQQQQQVRSSRAQQDAAGAGRHQQQQRADAELSQAPAAAAAAAIPVSDRSLAVRQEFDAAVWQQAIKAATKGSSSERYDAAASEPTTAAGAWYATSAQQQQQAQAPSLPQQQQHAAAAATPTPTTSSSSMKPAAIQRALLGFHHPSQQMGLLAAVFPAWADNGCWLVDQLRPGVISPAPTPAEAAVALKGLALAAKRAGFKSVQLQSLARERVVLGLCEALRLTPPRTAPHQPPDLSRRMWSIAKTYWLQTASTPAAQQQLLAAMQVAAAASSSRQPQGAQQQLQQQLQQMLDSKGAVPLGALLVQMQSNGGALTKQQLAAAQALVQASVGEQLRRSTAVSALWGLAAIGGHMFYAGEMEALCKVAQAKLGRWQLTAAELSDVAWALATSRHATPVLLQLESALMAAGGSSAATGAELTTLLWAFATLNAMPQQLLQQLEHRGWMVKPEAASKQQQQQQRSQQQQQQQQQSAPAAAGGSAQLSELRDTQLTTLAWSLACLQQVDGSLFRAVWREVCQRGRQLLSSADVRSLVQLAQAAIAVELEASYGPADLFCDAGTEALLAAAADAFKQQARALQVKKVHSTYQRAIAGTLSRLRVMHVLEDTTAAGYSVDVTIPAMRVAIEADGPSHFARTRGGSSSSSSSRRQQLGATAMKRRHLQGLGWSVVNVAYTVWDRLPDEEARVAYLRRAIHAARQTAASSAAEPE